MKPPKFAFLISLLLLPLLCLAQFSDEEEIYACPAEGYSVIAVADLDADGHSDLVMSTEFGSLLIAWGGYEDFMQEQYRFDSSYQYGEIELVDLDEDGDLDLIGRILNAEILLWRENLGDRQFQTNVLEEQANYLGHGDLNQDGIPDLLYTSADNGIFSADLQADTLLQNNTFIHTFSQIDWHAEVLDMDGDGDLDIVHGTNLLLMKEPTGYFPFENFSSDIPGWVPVHYVDVNEDGLPDIVGAFLEIAWLRNEGLMSFVEQDALVEDSKTTGIHIADLTGDAQQDLLYKTSENKVFLMEKTGPSTYAPAEEIASVAPNSMLITTFEGDANPSLILSCPNQQMIATVEHNAAGQLEERFILGPYLGAIQDMEFADLNGDGLDDIIACSPEFRGLSILHQKADGGFEIQEGATDTWWIHQLATGPVLGNGQHQVVFAEGNKFDDAYGIYLCEINEQGHVEEPVLVHLQVNVPGSSELEHVGNLQLADVDLDGLTDILYTERNQDGIRLIRQIGTGEFLDQGQLSGPNAPGFILCDFAGNGLKDIVGIYGPNLSLFAQEQSGYYADAAPLSVAGPVGWIDNMQCRDINNDGIEDLVYRVIGNGIFATMDVGVNYGGDPTAPGELLQSISLDHRSVTAINIDDDERMDHALLLQIPASTKLLDLYSPDESFNWTLVQQLNTRSGPLDQYDPLALDIDSDDDEDLVLLVEGNDAIILYRNERNSHVSNAETELDPSGIQLQYQNSAISISDLPDAHGLLRLFDLQGKIVHQQRFQTGDTSITLAAPKLAASTYLMQVICGDASSTRMVMWQ